MDSLVDEVPLVFLGLPSTEFGSSLYTKSQINHQQPTHLHQTKRERSSLPSWRKGRGQRKLRDDALNGPFSQTSRHVISPGRVREGLPVGRNIPTLLYQRSPRVSPRGSEEVASDETILREKMGPILKPTTRTSKMHMLPKVLLGRGSHAPLNFHPPAGGAIRFIHPPHRHSVRMGGSFPKCSHVFGNPHNPRIRWQCAPCESLPGGSALDPKLGPSSNSFRASSVASDFFRQRSFPRSTFAIAMQ